ncbi:MAG TPA: PRC-barrel domain-containing protein [Blastocatellia bacterium]|nr:PRC-barrel domain-containing protein [Blastocatellia bacterium]
MKLSELLRMEVVARDGRHLGWVIDLRCAGEPEHGDARPERIVSELVYGKAGWLERLGFRAVRERRTPWAAVTAIENGRIIIADEAE